jgi:hypothetical protein
MVCPRQESLDVADGSQAAKTGNLCSFDFG